MRERGRNLIRCGAAFAVSCCLLAGNVFPAAADTSVSGATMRLSSREGTVNVSGKGGKAVAAFDNMRLQSGYNLETEAASYAGLALDDVKAVKMDELSKGEIRKKGKQLELLLSEGSLLCDVTAPLKGEESLSIRTSTMITGIRGTVVYAEVVDSNTSRVCVLEGQVLVRPVNPVEGDRNGQYIEKGRQALIIGPDRMERKGEIQTLPLTEADIAPYVLWEIHENEELAKRLREAGWDVDWMIENAERLLREEEDKNSQWAEKGQGTSGSKPGGKDIHTPLYNGGDSGSDSGTGTQPGRPTVELTMPVSPETIEEKLRTSDVVLHSAADSNPLIIDNSLTVPAGSRLELAGGMGLVVGTSAALQVDGTLIVDGNLENRGTVTNTSMNTLDIKGDYVGSGTLNNKGRVAAIGSFMQEGGSFQTIGQGRLEVGRKAVIDNAAFDFGTGTTLFHGDLTVRNADGEFGDNLCVEGMLSLEDSSILITGGFYSGGITAVKKQDGENIAYEELNLEGGKVLAERGVKGVIFAENYKLNVQSGILERSDDGIPFITGTGILEMDGEEYKIEELTESMFESEETETGWVLTGIVQEQKKQAEVLTSIPLQADAEKLPDVNEEEKELQEGENLPEEGEPEEGSPEERGNQPEEGEPEEGENRPEEGEPEEGGNQPEEGEPDEGGNRPEEGEPDEGGNRPEEGEPEEGGSQPEEGSSEEGGNRTEEGEPGEGGNRPEEGSPEEGANRPEEGSLEEGGNRPEEGSPEESGNRPEEGSLEEGGNRPEEGSPEESGNRPEEGSPEEGAANRLEEGGNRPEEGSPEEGRNQPEEGSSEEGGNRSVEGIPEKGKNQLETGKPEEYGNLPG
ncbi:FecR domain-containing protein [Enterocloster bolteae]|uniref:FecR domain-containing protein n=1 Tax=Enterocloster bolteae TaxID=208479 RepID=UPI00326065BB